MRRIIRIAAPFVIIGGLVVAAMTLMRNPPESGRRPPQAAPMIAVEAQRIDPVDYRVILGSFGTVQPSIRSQLVAQVGGQINWVSPSLRDGGYFEAGEVLLRLDARDYEADLAIAEANLIDARRALIEAEAQARQAQEDWANLGREGQPSDLTLKIPQRLAAEARVKSAESALAKAQLALERTEIAASFDGRVLDQRVDLGQVVAPSTVVADIYATDAIEVRLPIRNRDLAFIDLPEQFRDASTTPAVRGNMVVRSELGDAEEWIGDLVRTEGAIDDSAQQLHVVGRIEDPFGANAQSTRPLKIGEYVSARLAGVVLPDAIVIPNTAIYQGSFVYLVEQGLLKRTDIDIIWQNEEDAVIGDGLASGDLLVLTPLGQVTSGMRVAIEGEARPRERADASNPRGPAIGGSPRSEQPGGSRGGPGNGSDAGSPRAGETPGRGGPAERADGMQASR